MRSSSRVILAQRRAALSVPLADRLSSWQRWLLSAAALTAFLLLLHHALGSWLTVTAMLLAFLVIITALIATESHRLKRLALDRTGESICSFSRAFPKATRNPLLIRAVYETIQQDYLNARVPLRASDRLTEVLNTDDGEIDFITIHLADLTERSMANCEINPLYGRVKTPADLVAFLQHQPLLPHAPGTHKL
ncbi:MAG: hypothetical protein JWL81_2772 [Verrucomicrobiales bacterium]|nr:hypothetical protein [Verrucomicrobiales bacterium]